MHFRCVFALLLCCVLIDLDWAEPIMHLYLHVTCSCIFMHTHLQVSIFVILYLVSAFLIVSLSLPFSLFLMLVASWHLSVNFFCPGTFFVLGHLLLLLLLTLLLFAYSSVMRRPNRTSQRTFHNVEFIRNAKSFCQISLTLTYPLSSTIGVRSHCVASRSRALPWSYKSSTPICTYSIILYPSLLLAFEVYAW